MKSILTVLFALSLFQTSAQTETLRKTNFNLKKDIALEGYDPVSFFDGKPLEGNSNIKASFKGVIYLFYSKQNLEKFKTDPVKYEPAYGGWCAYAMGESGEKVKVDPETYKILDGKLYLLYLFYNFWGNNTLNTWNKNEEELKKSADKNWQKYIP
jgi:YHS domain-containing protein